MHGLVSLLPSPYYEQVENLWKELEEEQGLQGIKVTPFPHFSWQIAEHYDFEKLEQIISDWARSTPPFTIRTAGIGLFTGIRPVIYIPVVKNTCLVNLHAQIWERTQQAGQELSPYYHPEFWMPHISLAYEDISIDNIARVMQKLAFQPFTWEMSIDNIALIFEPEGEIGALKFRLALSGD